MSGAFVVEGSRSVRSRIVVQRHQTFLHILQTGPRRNRARIRCTRVKRCMAQRP